jgi:hypothetical protein
MRARRWWFMGCLVGLVGSAGARAHASPTSAAAEVQFDKGRELMKAGLFSEACAAFDQSERLDPQIGTLYNLAGCWEKIGKLASAWTAYREVAQRDSNAVRRKAADEHAHALEPRLARLVIKLDAAPAGVTVSLNGGDVTKLVGIEVPMDLGTYAVLVSARGFQPWGGEAKVTVEGALVTVKVPPLLPVGASRANNATTSTTTRPTEPAQKTTPPPKVVIPPPVAEPRDTGEPAVASSGGGGHGTLTIVTAAGGGTFLIGGLVVGVLARNKLNDAEKICPDKMCAKQEDLADANRLLAASRTRGNISTGLVAVGAAGLVASAILWWTGRHDEDAAPAPHTAIAPVASPSMTGLVVTGSF